MVTDRSVTQRADDAWRVHLADSDLDSYFDAGGQIVGIDAAGRVWVASDDTAEIAAWDGADWTPYTADEGWTPVGTGDDWYRAINWGQNDRRERFWLATSEDVRVFDGKRWAVYHPEDMGIGPPEHEELIHDFHLRVMQESEWVWLGACEWAGPGPVGGRGVRWFDGETWQGADSPVASGCAMAIEEDPSGRVWLGVQAVVWRYDPASGDWARFAPPDDPPDENERWRYGAVTDIDLDAAGDPWVTILLCGGASCDTEVLYHVSDGVWTQVGGLGFYRGAIIEVDGTPWFFGSGVHRIEGATLEMVAPLLIESVAVDDTGTVWFVAQYRGAEHLWAIARESGEN
jgi:hypothetical protein